MKKTSILFFTATILLSASCHKPKTTTTTAAVSETQITSDFVSKIALPQYQDLQTKAATLNTAINNLNTSATDADLTAAREAWRDMRATWEQCEGFLLGPVEDDNYDPNMDTWPVDYLQLDSFIYSSSSFDAATIQNLSQSLRGFHPIEFILWGKNGNATAASITAKQKQYMVGLSKDLLASATALNNSWAVTGGNFQAQVLNAGTGSARFATKQELFIAILSAMSGICEEVAGGKIAEPFNTSDSTKTESPFSHNSITDFTNNIIGSRNVYTCTYGNVSGQSLSALVAGKNISLDNKIRSQYTTAINALGNVTVSFETAVITQRTQLQNAMDAISSLQETLDGELKVFIMTNVKD